MAGRPCSPSPPPPSTSPTPTPASSTQHPSSPLPVHPADKQRLRERDKQKHLLHTTGTIVKSVKAALTPTDKPLPTTLTPQQQQQPSSIETNVTVATNNSHTAVAVQGTNVSKVSTTGHHDSSYVHQSTPTTTVTATPPVSQPPPRVAPVLVPQQQQQQQQGNGPSLPPLYSHYHHAAPPQPPPPPPPPQQQYYQPPPPPPPPQQPQQQNYQQPPAHPQQQQQQQSVKHSSAQPRHTASHSDPVLPRSSKVRIVGNNRTKWDLLGRIGIVRSAQTLGGWHEVELTDGGIVRVQRNALAVLELPSGDSTAAVRIECGAYNDRVHSNSNNNNKNHSLGMHQGEHGSSPIAATYHHEQQQQQQQQHHHHQQQDRENINNSNRHNSPSPYNSQHQQHKATNLNKKKGGKVMGGGIVKMKDVGSMKSLHANLSKLNLNSLRRYRRVYNLNVCEDSTKDELVGAVTNHFHRVTVNETEVICNFLRYLAKHTRDQV